MIKKIIACADLHFRQNKGLDEQKEVFSNFIEQCKEIVEREGKDSVRIAVAGDVFDNKLAITNESILAVHWFLSELNKICKTIVIAGNHDLLQNNLERIDSITPIFEIGDLKNVVYLDRELGYKSGCYEDDNVVWCLYSIFDGFNSPCIKAERVRFENENKIYVGLVHGDINGAVSPTNYATGHGLNAGIFEDCDLVIAGHIHMHQEIKENGVKIVYCSSLRQKDFGERRSEHGFVLWDLTDEDGFYDYEYVETPNENGGFFKFSINSLDDIEEDYEEFINH